MEMRRQYEEKLELYESKINTLQSQLSHLQKQLTHAKNNLSEAEEKLISITSAPQNPAYHSLTSHLTQNQR
jgi:chaperonin cofactor prefoldin